MNIFTKIKNIIKSRFIYNKDVPKWVTERRKICGGCEYNFKNKPIQKRTIRDYTWYFLNGFDSQCVICGCSVKNKTKIKEEFCSKEQIGKKALWDVKK